MNQSASTPAPILNPGPLFTGSCFALIATSVCFGVVGAVMGSLKEAFLLTNEQVGEIGGAALYGFAFSIIILGTLCDVMGMKNLFRFSFLCHLTGTSLMIFAQGYGMLYAGALVLAFGNGAVEAAGNPLVATLYPKEKTKKMNQFHVWFPGGIVIGGVSAYLLTRFGLGNWQVKLALIYIPTLIYGFLFLGRTFPATERLQSGISFAGMVKGAVARPIFWVLLVTISITASLELGPNRWIPAVLESGGLPGILVLAYINGLMAILRFYAGPVVERISPTGVILASVILGGIGLYWFSYSQSLPMAFLSATIFAVGVCYIWPTLLGITSERVPKSGAFGLALMGGTGMLIVGWVTSPAMGLIADRYLHEALPQEETVAVLHEVTLDYPAHAADEAALFQAETAAAVALAAEVITYFEANGKLPEIETANALRSALKNVPNGAEVLHDKIATQILGPADNYGGRLAFRYIAPFALIVVAIFTVLFIQDRRKGGYKAETLQDG